MGLFSDIVLFVIIIILLLISGVFATKSAIAVKDINNYDTDSELQKAHRYLTGAAIACWLGVFIIIVIIGIYIFFVGETVFETGTFFTVGLLIFTIFLTVLVGALSIIAARAIDQSSNYKSSNSSAHKDAIIASVVSIGGIGFIFITMIFVLISASQRNKNKTIPTQSTTQPIITGQSSITGNLTSMMTNPALMSSFL